MPKSNQVLKIPKTLIDPNKVFSTELAEAEIAAHGKAYKEAYFLHDALTVSEGDRTWVPLPGTQQKISLGKNTHWDGNPNYEFLHLFGIVTPAAKKAKESPIHLATFSEVSHVAGTWLKVPGVALMEERHESRQPALPSTTPEFQFVTNTLAVMRAYAVEAGLLAANTEAESPLVASAR